MTVLEQIGEMLAAAPAATDERLALHVLDTIGAWIAGRTSEEACHLAKLKTAQPFAVLGSGVLDEVALRVGTTRLSEIDDIHLPSCTTAGSIVVTAALACAGRMPGVKAAAFGHALRDGYGVMTAFGTAISGPTILRRGVWPTYLLAPLGTAAVMARLLGLDAARTAHALAIALTMTSGGVGDPQGMIPRWLLVGMAARQGCIAALAAADGFAGDCQLLDSDWLTRVHGIELDTPVLTSPMPTMSTMSMKPYCAAKQTMAAIEGFLRLVNAGIAIEDIAAVKVYVMPNFVRMTGHRNTGSRSGRLTGIACQLATAIYHPANLLDVNRRDITSDGRMKALIERVEVIGDPELAPYFPEFFPARVEITTADGGKETALVTAAWGDPGNQFSAEEVKAKFHRLSDAVLGETQAESLRDACLASTSDDGALAQLCRQVEELSSGAK